MGGPLFYSSSYAFNQAQSIGLIGCSPEWPSPVLVEVTNDSFNDSLSITGSCELHFCIYGKQSRSFFKISLLLSGFLFQKEMDICMVRHDRAHSGIFRNSLELYVISCVTDAVS